MPFVLIRERERDKMMKDFYFYYFYYYLDLKKINGVENV